MSMARWEFNRLEVALQIQTGRRRVADAGRTTTRRTNSFVIQGARATEESRGARRAPRQARPVSQGQCHDFNADPMTRGISIVLHDTGESPVASRGQIV